MYIKLNPAKNASMFWDPTQKKKESQTLVNLEQVIEVEETKAVNDALTAKGIIEAKKEEFDAYNKKKAKEDQEQASIAASQKGGNLKADAAMKAADQKLSEANALLVKINEEKKALEALNSEAEEKLAKIEEKSALLDEKLAKLEAASAEDKTGKNTGGSNK